MKLNKTQTNKTIIVLANSRIRPCTKLQMDNIIFPRWSDLGLLGMIFSQKIKTKEQPLGCDYDESIYQVVMRIINGKVLMTGGRPDAYTWKHSKVLALIGGSTKVRLVGVNSVSAILNLSEIIYTIADIKEKKMFADMFCSLSRDLLLITTEAEDRRCIEVTQDLYDAGLTACVDSWMKPDKNGDADATLLNVGDFLIVEDNGFYCIRRDEFLETHSING